jgi:hypothetical protein
LISSLPLNPFFQAGAGVPQPSVLTHLAFDPASHGKALLTVSSGIDPRLSLSLFALLE